MENKSILESKQEDNSKNPKAKYAKATGNQLKENYNGVIEENEPEVIRPEFKDKDFIPVLNGNDDESIKKAKD